MLTSIIGNLCAAFKIYINGSDGKQCECLHWLIPLFQSTFLFTFKIALKIFVRSSFALCLSLCTQNEIHLMNQSEMSQSEWFWRKTEILRRTQYLFHLELSSVTENMLRNLYFYVISMKKKKKSWNTQKKRIYQR